MKFKMEDSGDVHSISNNIWNLTGIPNLKASLLNLQLLRKQGMNLKIGIWLYMVP